MVLVLAAQGTNACPGARQQRFRHRRDSAHAWHLHRYAAPTPSCGATPDSPLAHWGAAGAPLTGN